MENFLTNRQFTLEKDSPPFSYRVGYLERNNIRFSDQQTDCRRNYKTSTSAAGKGWV